MIDPMTSRLWMYRILYLLVATAVIFFRLLPLDLSAGRWPGPDLLVVFAFAWVMRRPAYVPVLLVGAIFLTADMLFLRPPGLWAALGVLGLEFLRSREHLSRDLPFLVEWMMVSGVLISMTLAYRLILVIFVVNQPSFGLTLIQLIATLLSYPAAVAISRLVFSVRKIAPGEVDQLGHPL